MRKFLKITAIIIAIPVGLLVLLVARPQYYTKPPT